MNSKQKFFTFIKKSHQQLKSRLFWKKFFLRMITCLLIVAFIISPIGPAREKPVKAAEPVTITVTVLAQTVILGCALGMTESFLVWAIAKGGFSTMEGNPEFIRSLGVGCVIGALFIWIHIPGVKGWLEFTLHEGVSTGLAELADLAYARWFEPVIEEIFSDWWMVVEMQTNPTYFWANALLNEKSRESQYLKNVWLQVLTTWYEETNQSGVVIEIQPVVNLRTYGPASGTVYQSGFIQAEITQPEEIRECADSALEQSSDIDYVEFGYSFENNTDNILPISSPNSNENSKDWYGCNGWGLDFDLVSSGINSVKTIYIAARAADIYGNTTNWALSNALTADPRFQHNYSLSNIRFSPSIPNEDDIVQVTATITNTGATNESNVRIEFLVDDRFNNSHYIGPLNAGASVDTTFSWTATSGAHSFSLEAELADDGDYGDNSIAKTILVGNAPLVWVNGSSTPAAQIVAASTNGVTSNFNALVQNVGTAATTVTISKGGTYANWITLGASSFGLGANQSQSYSYSLTVPSGLSVGEYGAAIYFDWIGGTRVTLPITIQVGQYTVGEYSYNFTPSSGTINGTLSTPLTRGIKSNITLDNYTSTADPISITDTFSLSTDEFYRVPSNSSGEWSVNVDEIQSETTSTGAFFKLSGFETTKTSDFVGTFTVSDEFLAGGNPFFIGLSYLQTFGNNSTWIIQDSRFIIPQASSVWYDSAGFSPGDSTVALWEAGWDYARICGTVGSVTRAGDVSLFNGTEKVYTRTITTTNIGSSVCWSISPAYLYGVNKFSLRPTSGGAQITLSNIYFYVKYFTGQPSIQANRTLSTVKASINQNVTATLRFTNNGSNIAENTNFTEMLPPGIQLVSGSTSGSMADINPGAFLEATYTFSGATPGTYTIPGLPVQYQDPSNNNYMTLLNATAFEIWGGTLQPVLETPPDGEVGISTPLQVSVTDSLTSNAVTDATVIATITQPDSSTYQLVLPWNASEGKYIAHFPPSDAGNYQITVSASRLFYTTGSTPPLVWKSYLQNQEPLAGGGYFRVAGDDPLKINLTATPTLDVDGLITEYAWDLLNDGTVDLYGRNLSYTFTTAGTYPIKLTVTDNKGAVDEVSFSATVTENIIYTDTVPFTPGWNLMALSLQPESVITAQQLCEQIASSGINVIEIDRWYAGGWDSHICGMPFNDFSIDLGKGFFARTIGTGNWSYQGTMPIGTISIPISPGWNLISIPGDRGITANELLSEMNTQGLVCSELDRWYAGGWDAHIFNVPFNDFLVEMSVGYFVRCQNSGNLNLNY